MQGLGAEEDRPDKSGIFVDLSEGTVDATEVWEGAIDSEAGIEFLATLAVHHSFTIGPPIKEDTS